METTLSRYEELARAVSAIGAVKRGVARVLPAHCQGGAAAVLALVKHHGDMRMSRLAELMAVDMSVCSRHVAHTVEHGWIERLPDPDELARARALVGYDKIRLDAKERTVQLTVSGMLLDLGAIAKGYAVEAALEVLRRYGLTRALVAASGDIVAGDPPPGARGWKVAIEPL